MADFHSLEEMMMELREEIALLRVVSGECLATKKNLRNLLTESRIIRDHMRRMNDDFHKISNAAEWSFYNAEHLLHGLDQMNR